MNRRMKLIESYLLLLADVVSITLAYAAAILLRFKKFAWVMEPELHFLVYIGFLLFCTIYSFFFDWNREFLKRGVLVEFIAVTKFDIFMELAVMACLFVLQAGARVSRLAIGYFAIFNLLLVWIVRLCMKKALRIYFTTKSNMVKMMIITKKALLHKTVEKLKAAMDINYEIVALACMDADVKGEEVQGVTVNADREDALDLARQMPDRKSVV